MNNIFRGLATGFVTAELDRMDQQRAAQAAEDARRAKMVDKVQTGMIMAGVKHQLDREKNKEKLEKEERIMEVQRLYYQGLKTEADLAAAGMDAQAISYATQARDRQLQMQDRTGGPAVSTPTPTAAPYAPQPAPVEAPSGGLETAPLKQPDEPTATNEDLILDLGGKKYMVPAESLSQFEVREPSTQPTLQDVGFEPVQAPTAAPTPNSGFPSTGPAPLPVTDGKPLEVAPTAVPAPTPAATPVEDTQPLSRIQRLRKEREQLLAKKSPEIASLQAQIKEAESRRDNAVSDEGFKSWNTTVDNLRDAMARKEELINSDAEIKRVDDQITKEYDLRRTQEAELEAGRESAMKLASTMNIIATQDDVGVTGIAPEVITGFTKIGAMFSEPLKENATQREVVNAFTLQAAIPQLRDVFPASNVDLMAILEGTPGLNDSAQGRKTKALIMTRMANRAVARINFISDYLREHPDADMDMAKRRWADYDRENRMLVSARPGDKSLYAATTDDESVMKKNILDNKYTQIEDVPAGDRWETVKENRVYRNKNGTLGIRLLNVPEGMRKERPYPPMMPIQ